MASDRVSGMGECQGANCMLEQFADYFSLRFGLFRDGVNKPDLALVPLHQPGATAMMTTVEEEQQFGVSGAVSA